MLEQMKPSFGLEETSALLQYMQSGGWMAEYKKTEEFERMIAEYVGSIFCVVVNNATAGLFLALKAMGIGPGDEVVVPDYTMVATANAVVLAGATPVFHDINPINFCLDIDSVDGVITKKTKAIIYVSINGRSGPMDIICDFARRRHLYLIEDAAQSLGSTWNNQCLGTFGDAGIYSFSVPKIITTGNGGAVVTHNEKIASRILMMKDFGRTEGGKDFYQTMGWNFKFTDLQAVVGIEQMKKLSARLKRKRDIYRRYSWLLYDVVNFVGTHLDDTAPWFIDIITDHRDKLADYLLKQGIKTRPFYPALHSQPVYNQTGNYPIAERVSKVGLWLPSFIDITDSEIDFVCDKIKGFYAAI